MRPTRLLTGLSSMALVVLGLVALLPDCASACMCEAVAPHHGSQQQRSERALDRASAVFAGEVVDLEKGGNMWGEVPSTTVSFRVTEVWKGSERETLEVTTPSGEGMCGYSFSDGRKYLVYAEGKRMEVSSCGETKLLSESSADFEALGNDETLGGSGVLSDTSGGFPPLGVTGMVGGAVAVVSLVVLMRLVRTS